MHIILGGNHINELDVEIGLNVKESNGKKMIFFFFALFFLKQIRL